MDTTSQVVEIARFAPLENLKCLCHHIIPCVHHAVHAMQERSDQTADQVVQECAEIALENIRMPVEHMNQPAKTITLVPQVSIYPHIQSHLKERVKTVHMANTKIRSGLMIQSAETNPHVLLVHTLRLMKNI